MSTRTGTGMEIAVTGLDCRFPGAPDAAAYWELLICGAEAAGRHGPGQPYRIEDAHAFDHAFFAVNRAEAAAMDPQQRLLLQSVWRALEDSGNAPRALAGSRTGVYVGCMADDWSRIQLALPEGVTPRTGTGTGRAMLANRIAYQLDLRGPCLTVDTACSSSLVAVHLAATALVAGECDTAVAGGVNLVLSDVLDAIYEQAGLAAPDGRCKPFSADADGIGRAEGAGAVVLRRLADARRDGQPVYAVIAGSAVNQDGRSNGMMAPSRAAQRDVIESACRRAGIEPAEVGWVEAHGTGTALGDLIEARALGEVYGAGRGGDPCAVGSAKGSIGHAEGAAGLAGLVKAVLAMHHGVVPPSRHADTESPELDLAAHGLRLLTEPLLLPDTAPPPAGVSSFGMGGSNAHLVLTAAPREVPAAGPSVPGVFTLTADTPEALRRNLRVQAEALAARRDEPVAPLCWTSNRVRTGLRHRVAVTAAGTAELVDRLRSSAESGTPGSGTPDEPPTVGFLFTGQGSQYPGMTARLLAESPAYRAHMAEAAEELRPYVRTDIGRLLADGDLGVKRTGLMQPATFAVQYALAATFADLGIRPAAVLGHSIGEFAAACAAGALTLPEAARLVSVRGAFMEVLPPGGGMLSVRLGLAELQRMVDAEPRVGIGAVDGPGSTVLSGDLTALRRITGPLRERGVTVTALKVPHAFHSPLMAPALTRFARVAVRVPGRVPQLPFYSTVRGRKLCGEPLDGPYWTEHISAPVRFADAAAGLLASGCTHLVELGPRPVLGKLIRGLGGRQCLAPVRGEKSGLAELAEVAAVLFRAGADLDWAALYRPEDRTPLRRLPGQAFSTATAFRPEQPATGAGAVVTQLRVVEPTPAPGLDVAGAVRVAVAAIVGCGPEQLKDDSRFYDDLGFDSVMFMELKYRLEERLPALGELSIPEMMSSLITMSSLVDYLHRQLTSAAA